MIFIYYMIFIVHCDAQMKYEIGSSLCYCKMSNIWPYFKSYLEFFSHQYVESTLLQQKIGYSVLSSMIHRSLAVLVFLCLS